MLIKSHKELEVYKHSFNAALEVYKLTLLFPNDEKYSLTDQIRRSSRSVCANIAEAFRKRRYDKHFVSKLTDAESEAAETQVWLEFASAQKYIDENVFEGLLDKYEHIIAMIVKMQNQSTKWSVKQKEESNHLINTSSHQHIKK
ncbi:MAG: four helix bundle protein [Bacteroidetes bacterium]|nr:four helix bundle protein [Bacteroidota bacterium]